MPRHDVTSWIRVGAVGFAMLAAVATAVEMSREGRGSVGSPQPAAVRDPIAAELERCNAITPASGRDDASERAWAENRRRFLGAHRTGTDAPGAAPVPSTPAGVRP